MKTIKDYNYSFKHVQERLLERYNINITKSEYRRTLHNKLIDENCIKDEGEQLIYKINFRGKEILVVFCKKRGYITTVLLNNK